MTVNGQLTKKQVDEAMAEYARQAVDLDQYDAEDLLQETLEELGVQHDDATLTRLFQQYRKQYMQSEDYERQINNVANQKSVKQSIVQQYDMVSEGGESGDDILTGAPATQMSTKQAEWNQDDPLLFKNTNAADVKAESLQQRQLAAQAHAAKVSQDKKNLIMDRLRREREKEARRQKAKPTKKK